MNKLSIEQQNNFKQALNDDKYNILRNPQKNNFINDPVDILNEINKNPENKNLTDETKKLLNNEALTSIIQIKNYFKNSNNIDEKHLPPINIFSRSIN